MSAPEPASDRPGQGGGWESTPKTEASALAGHPHRALRHGGFAKGRGARLAARTASSSAAKGEPVSTSEHAAQLAPSPKTRPSARHTSSPTGATSTPVAHHSRQARPTCVSGAGCAEWIAAIPGPPLASPFSHSSGHGRAGSRSARVARVMGTVAVPVIRRLATPAPPGEQAACGSPVTPAFRRFTLVDPAERDTDDDRKEFLCLQR
jgi:hypothetical protein